MRPHENENIDMRGLFEFLRMKAGLSLYDVSYLLNVSTRTIRRWQSGTNSGYSPPQSAIDVIKWYLDGSIPRTWSDWRSHGVDMTSWRPKAIDGHSGISAGIKLRKIFGPEALA